MYISTEQGGLGASGALGSFGEGDLRHPVPLLRRVLYEYFKA